MNANELYTLLNDLPDDYVTAAAGTHRQSRRTLYMIVPALAACITLMIAAAVYPKLRTQQPERQDPVYTAETTAVTAVVTEPSTGTAVQTAQTAAPHTTRKQAAATTAAGTETQTVTQAAAAQHSTTAPIQNAEEQEPVTTKRKTSAVSADQTTAKQTVDAPASQTTALQTNAIPISRTTAALTGENPAGENPGSWFSIETQTVPYKMWTEYAYIPGDHQGGDNPTPATTPSTESPTVIGPDECTTPAVTTTAQPYPTEEEQTEPLVVHDGMLLFITPRKSYTNIMLTGGSLDENGILHLTLFALTDGTQPDNDETVQMILELPQQYSDAILGTKVLITETDRPDVFETIRKQTVYIYNRMREENEP